MKKNIKRLSLENIGYSDFFENNRKNSLDKSLTPSRIIAEHKELYILRNETSELSARITGKMMFTATSREDYPAVGDWVLISILDEEQAVIKEILPRKTLLKRKYANKSDSQLIAANIDTAFIIQSPDRDYNLNRFERYSAIAQSEKIKPVIVLNKIDLISEAELNEKVSELSERFNKSDIYTTSIVNGKGIDRFRESIEQGLTYCFLGSSGVGKSSIINKILGEDLIKTAEISSYANRGKHVTTHRELFILENGGILIDNPGMREIGIQDSETGIKNVFLDIFNLSKDCKYSDCNHIKEHGCAVLKAVDSGTLDKAKYDNYIKLVKENEYNTMTKLEKREKERKFGKFIKTAKKQIKKYKYE